MEKEPDLSIEVLVGEAVLECGAITRHIEVAILRTGQGDTDEGPGQCGGGDEVAAFGEAWGIASFSEYCDEAVGWEAWWLSHDGDPEAGYLG